MDTARHGNGKSSFLSLTSKEGSRFINYSRHLRLFNPVLSFKNKLVVTRVAFDPAWHLRCWIRALLCKRSVWISWMFIEGKFVASFSRMQSEGTHCKEGRKMAAWEQTTIPISQLNYIISWIGATSFVTEISRRSKLIKLLNELFSKIEKSRQIKKLTARFFGAFILSATLLCWKRCCWAKHRGSMRKLGFVHR